MKQLSRAFCVALVLVGVPFTVRAVTQSESKQAVSPAAVVGQWRGLMESTPAVDLTIKQAGGSLAGNIVFFRIQPDNDGNPKVVGQDEAPLQEISWKSGVLSFGVRRGQDTVRFTMQPSGSMRADLKRVGAPSDEPALLLTRKSTEAK